MGRAFSAVFFWLFAAGVAGSAGLMVGLGGLLVSEGGSWFYLLSGLVLLASAVQLMRKRRSAIVLAALVFAATWIWALAEVGLDGWALLPRVNFISVLLPLYALPCIAGRLKPVRRNSLSGQRPSLPATAYAAGAVAVATIVAVLVALQPTVRTAGDNAIAERSGVEGLLAGWRHPGQDPGGARFADLSQIDRANVHQLKRVWTYTEEKPGPLTSQIASRDEAVPLEIDGRLFICLANNVILALDAEDGSLLWRHDPQVDLDGVLSAICRGVAYYDAGTDIGGTGSVGTGSVGTGSVGTGGESAFCAQSIILGTLDARLIALDAATGKPCPEFGQGGQVSLKQSMGPVPPGQYYITSPPAVIDGYVIVGGLVQDGISVGEPSGVIRAFDARTGQFAWAWDMGRPGETGMPEAPGMFTRGTPNSWTLMSGDPELGLVYVPTGNATPDFVGSHRDPLWEDFASSVVALDVKTGEVRWSYQMVRHDLWDHDLAAQPVLFDMPTEQGPVPALLQATKGGQLFVLDRRDGTPLVETVERAVPQTDVPGEWTAPTQPFPVGMPDLGGGTLTEADMWGITPFDQLLCRINFRQFRYDGIYTPPALGEGSMNYPGQLGGVEWGSVTIDPGRNLLIVPSNRFAMIIKLVPRTPDSRAEDFAYPQEGTDYGVVAGPFMTALGVPCQQPPFAILTAIDLNNRETVWERPLGVAEDLGPFGIASRLPFTIGAPPVVGGPVATAGDITFIGAVGDRRLRAIDSLTGKELWSDKLPEGSQATPITYVAPRSGKQMVVMVSGSYAAMNGGGHEPAHIVAYALD